MESGDHPATETLVNGDCCHHGDVGDGDLWVMGEGDWNQVSVDICAEEPWWSVL